MAIRLRQVADWWVALCAVESDPKAGDIYIDDAQHYALSCKFAREQGLWDDVLVNEIADTQKVRDAKEEIEKWQSAQQRRAADRDPGCYLCQLDQTHLEHVRGG